MVTVLLIPSNLLMKRVSGKYYFPFVMIGFGTVVCCITGRSLFLLSCNVGFYGSWVSNLVVTVSDDLDAVYDDDAGVYVSLDCCWNILTVSCTYTLSLTMFTVYSLTLMKQFFGMSPFSTISFSDVLNML